MLRDMCVICLIGYIMFKFISRKRMLLYICIFVYVCTHMHVCVYAYMYSCKCRCVCTGICMYERQCHAHAFICVQTACTHAHVCAYICVGMCVCAYSYDMKVVTKE